MFDRVLNVSLIMIQLIFLSIIPFKNCFSWELNKKEDMSDEFAKSVCLIKIFIYINIDSD